MKKRTILIVTIGIMLITLCCISKGEKIKAADFYCQRQVFLQREFERVLPKVEEGDYSKAYAEALSEGLKIPSQKAKLLIKANEEKIEYQPRLVIDENEEIHIIWTNDEMLLVVDGEDTDLKVADCIYVNELPELPKDIETLEKNHKNTKVKYGIAENAFLEEFTGKLVEKGIIEKKSLWWVRFYNDNGKLSVVYSLTKEGKLYINENLAETLLPN